MKIVRCLLVAPLLAVLAVLACSGGGSKASGAPPALDTSKPDDALLAQALVHYDNASALAKQAYAQPAGSAARASYEAQAVAEYQAAIPLFAALPVQFPSSIRRDQAAYLEGRSHYEIGTLTPLPGSTTEFGTAQALLDAAEAAFPTSYFRDGMTYFDGRARFHLADQQLVAASAGTSTGTSSATIRAGFEASRDQLVLSLAANATGTWSDNSKYYLGRCDYEVGHVYQHPVELGATAPVPGTPEFADDVAHFDRAKAELAAVPAGSTYADNARYYLGRSFFEAPSDTTLLDWRTRRVAALDTAMSDFTAVIGTTSTYAVDARYWRGRSYYAREAYQPDAAAKNGDLVLAAADFKAIPATQHYRDNALYDLAKCYVKFSITAVDPAAPYCLADRPGDPAPASACAAKTALDTLVATDPAFAASPYPARTVAYLAAAPTPCTCP